MVSMQPAMRLPTIRGAQTRGSYSRTQLASVATIRRPEGVLQASSIRNSRLHSSPGQPVCGPLAARGRVILAPSQAFPFDLAWSPNLDTNAIAPQLFAFSLLPYLVFLFFLTTSGKAPKLTLAGFWFLLVFVGATIPAGIYAKVQYGTALANVDWLHGTAESLLTVTNLLIVLGLRQGIRQHEEEKAKQAAKDDGKP